MALLAILSAWFAPTAANRNVGHVYARLRNGRRVYVHRKAHTFSEGGGEAFALRVQQRGTIDTQYWAMETDELDTMRARARTLPGRR